ncbi:MAG: alpha/beta fold hydrolase [Rhizomicrobium sp.]
MARIYKSQESERRLIETYRAKLSSWPVSCQHLYVPTSQGETFVIASGEKTAPPLLLLHGAGANALAWLADIAAWSAHFRVYAVDLIGEPGLSAPSRPPLTSSKYAHWLGEVMDALSLERAHLLGVSLGGWLAIDFATRFPQRVSRLVLLCPGGVGTQRSSFLFKAGWLLLLGDRGRDKAVVLALGPDAKKAPPESLAYVQEVFKDFIPRASELPMFSDAALQRLTMPVLLIVGARDAMLDSGETVRRLLRAAPKLEARTLPDTGHLILGQTDAVIGFLRAA